MKKTLLSLIIIIFAVALVAPFVQAQVTVRSELGTTFGWVVRPEMKIQSPYLLPICTERPSETAGWILGWRVIDSTRYDAEADDYPEQVRNTCADQSLVYLPHLIALLATTVLYLYLASLLVRLIRRKRRGKQNNQSSSPPPADTPDP